jgi:signal transduction histidine kinase
MRPPWWPDEEPWPPQRAPWQVNRRAIFFRLAIGFVILLTLIVGIALLAIHFSGQAWEGPENGDRPRYWIIGPILFWSLIIGIVVFVVRRISRNVSPLFDLVEALNRLSAGDYTTRVDPAGQARFRTVLDAFNATAGKLEASDLQRRRLLADIAHELRTPLAVIQGNVEGMIDQVYPRDDAHLEPLLRETQLISRLLDDLQTLAQAEAGTLALYMEQVDLSALVEDIVSAYRPTATAAGVELTMAGPASLPEVEIDPIRMRQVLENLLSNALRYTTAGGSIRLVVERQPEAIVIRVIDSGSGIAPELVPHIFDRFVKAADSGGSGLGLAIASRIVEAHGGTIAAASEEGQGTTITLTLFTTTIFSDAVPGEPPMRPPRP